MIRNQTIRNQTTDQNKINNPDQNVITKTLREGAETDVDDAHRDQDHQPH